ncbi:MAG: AAA family ATPase [Bacteroidota bacterium]
MDNMTPDLLQNANVLTEELVWLREVINARLALYFHHETSYQSIDDVTMPDISSCTGAYATFLKKHEMNKAERLVLILALAPHLSPGVLDILTSKNKDYERRFSEFGGLFMEGHAGLIPTAETAMFILAGDDISKRINYRYLFRTDHLFHRMRIIHLQVRDKEAPRLSGTWMVAHEYVDYLVSGEPYEVGYSEHFPAVRITTRMEWQDMILTRRTLKGLQEIRDWAQHGDKVLNDLGLGRRLKPGYKSLFYGPPGTGKTMAAALLGKITHTPVYKVDLSLVVSKYIGEREKNLDRVFDMA